MKKKKKIKLWLAVKESDCQGKYFTKEKYAVRYLNGEPGWIERVKIEK